MITRTPINCQFPWWSHRSVGLPLKHRAITVATLNMLPCWWSWELWERVYWKGKVCVPIRVCYSMVSELSQPLPRTHCSLRRRKKALCPEVWHIHRYTHREVCDQTHTHKQTDNPPGCLLSQLTFTQATHSWPIHDHVTKWEAESTLSHGSTHTEDPAPPIIDSSDGERRWSFVQNRTRSIVYLHKPWIPKMCSFHTYYSNISTRHITQWSNYMSWLKKVRRRSETIFFSHKSG